MSTHVRSVTLHQEKYPSDSQYPFTLPVFNSTKQIHFDSPVTFFVGENGSGKSTLLEAIARACNIHIWQKSEGTRYRVNRYGKELYRYLTPEFLEILRENSAGGHAQFIIATHSPILLSFEDARIYSFDHSPVDTIGYRDTQHYQLYKSFLMER